MLKPSIREQRSSSAAMTTKPLLERVLFFNNSLLTRSRLFRGFPGPPITSYNNAVTFIGCGKDGDVSCRQEVDCGDSALWTEDRSALFAG